MSAFANETIYAITCVNLLKHTFYIGCMGIQQTTYIGQIRHVSFNCYAHELSSKNFKEKKKHTKHDIQMHTHILYI